MFFHLLLVLLFTAGCFRAPDAYAEGGNTPHTLLVQDPGGAQYAPLLSPRDPRLTLQFDDGVPADAERALVLLPGVLEPAFFARFATRTSALEQRGLPLVLTPERASLRVQPRDPLLPGARYTLGWLAGADSQRFVLATAQGSALGARRAESWPSDADSQVPARLARLLLRFDGSVLGDVAAAVTLESDTLVPTRLHVESCALRGLPEGDCVWLEPEAMLTPGARYRLVLAAGLSTLTGAALAPSETSFEVAREMNEPVQLLPTRCGLDEEARDELCLRSDEQALYVRGSTSQSALLTLLHAGESVVARTASLSFANTFSLRLALPAGPSTLLLRATDLTGQSVERELTSTLERDLPSVIIDEARPDPLGKEPAQEYVELLNFGATPVSLMGFTLSTDLYARGRTVRSATTLAPGERALLVSPDFDAHDLRDGTLPAGTRIASLDGSLSLSNGGDPLFLRDARGRRLSTTRVIAPLLEGQCSARLAANSEPREGDLSLDPRGACTPGTASFDEPTSTNTQVAP